MLKFNTPDAEKVKGMFSEIAGNYDKANSVLSFGIHHLWRKKLVNWSGITEADSVLDCASGTGDLAIEFKKNSPKSRVIGTDFCAEMLASAPNKAKAKGLEIEFSQADVTQLPFKDNEFSIASIAFGIRNVERPDIAIKELQRVLKDKGQLFILEFGQPKAPVFSQAYDLYSKKVLPYIGGAITGKSGAYKYLQDSSERFPCRLEFLEFLKESANFSELEFKSLSGGIAYIYRAVAEK